MVTDILHRVRSYLSQPNVTKAGLAARAGLHPNTLRDADKDNWNPTADTLRKLEPYLPSPDVPVASILSADKSDEIIRGAGGTAPRPFSPTSSRTFPSFPAPSGASQPSSTGPSAAGAAAEEAA